MNKKTCVLFLTNDNYSFLWDDYFYLLKKYWFNFSFDIIMNTERKKFFFEGLNIINISMQHNIVSWGCRLKNILLKIDYEFVILLMDDHFIYDNVDTGKIQEMIDYMSLNSKVSSISFENQPGLGKNKEDSFLRKRKLFEMYRISLQSGLWRKKYLLKLIKEYENPWQFEINGTFRSNFLNGKLYAINSKHKIIPTHSGALIMRGKLNQEIANYFRANENLPMLYPIDYYETPINKKTKKITRFIKGFKYLLEAISSFFKR